MATMNVSLPDDLKGYVDARVVDGSYQSSSEYVRELIRRDQEMQRFRELIREGLESPVEGVADRAFFDELRTSLRARAQRA
jgi:antitoxin ParD1/3/4